MKAKTLIIGVGTDTWFKGKPEEKKVPCLNCVDAENHLDQICKESFDYLPSDEEVKELDLGALMGASVILAVRQIKPGNGGRLRFVGQIDRSTLPKSSVRNGAAQAPTTTPAKV